MKRLSFPLVAGSVLLAALGFAFGQPSEERSRGQRPPRGPERGPDDRDYGPPPPPPPHALLDFFDADHDEQVSAEEMENAAAVLKKLDKNGDGKLSHDELPPPPHPPRPPRGRDDDGPRGHGPPPRGYGHRSPGPPRGECQDRQGGPSQGERPDEE